MELKTISFLRAVPGSSSLGPVANRPVSVYVADGDFTTLADGVLNSAGGAENPLTTDDNGQVQISAPNGEYDLRCVNADGTFIDKRESWIDVTAQVAQVAADALATAADRVETGLDRAAVANDRILSEGAVTVAYAAQRIFASSAAGQASGALVSGDYFYVITADPNVFELWTKGASTPTDTTKRVPNSVAIALGDQAAVTVSVTAGNVVLSAAQAAYPILILTGSPGTARNVAVPTAQWRGVVLNRLGDASVVTVKTGPGSGVVVAQGDTVHLGSDGTNVVALGPSVLSVSTVAAAAAGSLAQIAINDRAYYDPDTRVLSLPQVTAKLRSGATNMTWNPGTGLTFDITFSGTAAQMLYLDLQAATTTGNSPFLVTPFTTPIATDSRYIPVAYYWNNQLVPVHQLDLQYLARREDRVQHVASNLPIIYVNVTGYGVAAGTWMVPLTTRYVKNGTASNTLANAASSAVDPTGTYVWTAYTEVTAGQTGENSLYLDPGSNTVLSVGRTTKMKGTKQGFVELARYHSAGQLTALNGVRVFYVGQDPALLFGRVSSLESNLAAVPTVTFSDGSRLRRYRSKRAAIKGGATTPLKVTAIAADSWFDRPEAMQELLARFAADGLPMVSSGWTSFSGLGQSNGTAVTFSNFTYFDASVPDAAAYTSPDGSVLRATGTTGTLSITGIKGSDAWLEYNDANGAFEWRWDGGSWTPLTMGNTGGNLRVQVASGASTGGTHTLEVRTTINAGVVDLQGFYATVSSGAGVEVNRMGNGGSTSLDWTNLTAAVTRELGYQLPDLVLMHLGVNDQRLGVLPSSYKTQMQSVIAAIKAGAPGAAIVVIAPPRNSKEPPGGGTYPMSNYGDQLLAIYQADSKVALARFDTTWGDYAEEGPSGNNMLNGGDGFHLNTSAATGAWKRYIGDIYEEMLRVY